MIDAPKTPTAAAVTADPDETARLDAGRWLVWQSLARGLAHSLANAAQLLTLESPPAGLLAEARARVSRAQALLASASRAPDGGPSFLPAVLADFDALQQLQVGLPATTLEVAIEEPLPLATTSEAEVLQLLLLAVLHLKAARAGAFELHVRVRHSAGLVRVELVPGPTDAMTLPPASPGPAAERLDAAASALVRAGGRFRASGEGWEIGLPVARR